jgi:hypothetical protein
MAKATRNTKIEKKTKTVEVEERVPNGVNLVLTQEEAEVLRYITRHVSGDPFNGPRRHTDAIGRALLAAGVEPNVEVEATRSLVFPSAPPNPWAFNTLGFASSFPSF